MHHPTSCTLVKIVNRITTWRSGGNGMDVEAELPGTQPERYMVRWTRIPILPSRSSKIGPRDLAIYAFMVGRTTPTGLELAILTYALPIRLEQRPVVESSTSSSTVEVTPYSNPRLVVT